MITLNPSDIRFMETVLPLSESHRCLLKKLISKKKKLIPHEISEELGDLCSDRLSTHGFDDYQTPTEEGRKLEELQDKLYGDN
jgi:RIO-like serine/threonine protein kinase